MNAKLLAVSAAVLSLAAAAAAQAAPKSALQAFLGDAYAQAEAQLGGLDLSQRPVKVRAYVDGDGRLTGVRVVQSTGSHEADYQVQAAVKRVRVRDVPPGLIGAQVSLAFGPAATEIAKVP